MTEPVSHKKVIELITEAVEADARLTVACNEIEISVRTYNRWSGKTRDWSIENEVWLNPEKVSSVDKYLEEKEVS